MNDSNMDSQLHLEVASSSLEEGAGRLNLDTPHLIQTPLNQKIGNGTKKS